MKSHKTGKKNQIHPVCNHISKLDQILLMITELNTLAHYFLNWTHSSEDIFLEIHRFQVQIPKTVFLKVLFYK